ncbi:MAG: hypothetical protein FD123_3438 [Bacteroidetes bacterium]|nr:MAG: hypothetical protein FD123_3438 [Bacteroidota bacterium]
MFFCALLFFSFCTHAQRADDPQQTGSPFGEKIPAYNFNKPDRVLTLPDTLREVSGLTHLDSTTIACIQDENGILFFYDIANNCIKKQVRFYSNGDYEGIARVGQTLFILRSDGMLFEIPDYETGNLEPDSIRTGVPANNNEGLCYDAHNNRLLIACKSNTSKGPEHQDKRAIYAFDLKRRKLSDQPVFIFDLAAIKKFALEQGIRLPVNVKKKEEKADPVLRFRTSAIAIHPVSKKLYLLSAVDHLLFIFDMSGNIEHIEQLNQSVYNKAEGIGFFENGDVLISNEAQQKKPTLLRIRYHGD